MKVFVAGATGTLGLPLVRALVALKHQVTGLTRSAEKRSMLEKLGAEASVADALDAAALEKALRAASPDCVFHLLTAIPKNTLLRASHMKQTNVLRTTGTANLLKASVAAGVKRIVAESMSSPTASGITARARRRKSMPYRNASLRVRCNRLLMPCARLKRNCSRRMSRG